MLIAGTCDKLARLRKQSKHGVGRASRIGDAEDAEREGAQPSRAAACSNLCPLCIAANSQDAQTVLLISHLCYEHMMMAIALFPTASDAIAVSISKLHGETKRCICYTSFAAQQSSPPHLGRSCSTVSVHHSAHQSLHRLYVGCLVCDAPRVHACQIKLRACEDRLLG